ncbi:MAG TPA: CHRD domain-containing protein [Lacibacter sp.]|nr:CHRD domain-containing protein [Lacibacter sp.]
MKNYLIFFLVLFLGSSCKKDKETTVSTEVKFKAVMNGANEVPANSSTATGEANAVFNTQTKILTVTITYTGLSAALTAWHIHKAAAGVNGSVVFPLGTPQASGFIFTSTALTTDQETDLNSGLYYVNLHTANFSGGEIRGQLIKQ